MPDPRVPSPSRTRLASFRDAGRGVWHGLTQQPNGRVQLALAGATIALGLAVGLAPLEWCFVAGAVAGVTAAEVLNTAFERLADALCPEHHPGIGRAKDMAAGAVLLAAAGAAVVGAIVFVPRLLALAT
jgi:diacylglycerol kinase (ATP)